MLLFQCHPSTLSLRVQVAYNGFSRTYKIYIIYPVSSKSPTDPLIFRHFAAAPGFPLSKTMDFPGFLTAVYGFSIIIACKFCRIRLSLSKIIHSFPPFSTSGVFFRLSRRQCKAVCRFQCASERVSLRAAAGILIPERRCYPLRSPFSVVFRRSGARRMSKHGQACRFLSTEKDINYRKVFQKCFPQHFNSAHCPSRLFFRVLPPCFDPKKQDSFYFGKIISVYQKYAMTESSAKPTENAKITLFGRA